jgi:hypothetical protein
MSGCNERLAAHPESFMVKTILTASWIIAVTLAGLYGPALMRMQGNAEESQAPHSKPEPFKSDHIAVAIFKDGKVAGYFTARLSCTLVDNSLKDSLLAKLTHELYKAVNANAVIDFRKPQTEQLSALAGEMMKALNKRTAKPVIENLAIEEPDFLRRL